MSRDGILQRKRNEFMALSTFLLISDGIFDVVSVRTKVDALRML